MSEIFFESLSRKEWNAVSDYITNSLPTSSTDRATMQILVEFIELVGQFCSDDGTDDQDLLSDEH